VDESLSLQMVNSEHELTALMRDAETFLRQHGLNDRAVYIVNLVLEEVLTNILKYAYEDSCQHLIAVELALGEQDVRIVVEDDGREFDPRSVSPPRVNDPISDRHPGGLGIHLIRNLTDSTEYVRADNLNKFAVRILYR
jgi:serine/threonine-protein kinase RsbW